MGLIDSIKDLISGASDLNQDSIGDAVSSMGDIPGVHEIQDAAGSATDTVASVTEQGKTVIDDISGNLGL
jgi:hypothetical protein